MPRDPNRIDSILVSLTALWKENPDWRLGQLLSNAANAGEYEPRDPYYVEDNQLLKGIEELRNKDSLPHDSLTDFLGDILADAN